MKLHLNQKINSMIGKVYINEFDFTQSFIITKGPGLD